MQMHKLIKVNLRMPTVIRYNNSIRSWWGSKNFFCMPTTWELNLCVIIKQINEVNLNMYVVVGPHHGNASFSRKFLQPSYFPGDHVLAELLACVSSQQTIKLLLLLVFETHMIASVLIRIHWLSPYTIIYSFQFYIRCL